jgi:hypothetical protein
MKLDKELLFGCLWSTTGFLKIIISPTLLGSKKESIDRTS